MDAITILITLAVAVPITIIVVWIALSLCAVAKRVDEDADEVTGTEAPLTDAQVRQLLIRERYESECG